MPGWPTAMWAWAAGWGTRIVWRAGSVALVPAGSASPAGSPAVRRAAMASASARDRSPTMLTVAPRAV